MTIQQKRQIGKMTRHKNDNAAKWHVGKMAMQQNNNLEKWQVGELTIWQNDMAADKIVVGRTCLKSFLQEKNLI